ncbi:MAG: hypothetical protein ACPL28_12225 [bacterium]
MRKVIILTTILVIWAYSAPNVDEFAQIIVKEGGSSYIDSEGKLWVLQIKWHTRETGFPAHTSIVILPNGKIDSIYHPPRLFSENLYPYLYFRLYDKEGNKINEGVVQDSVEIWAALVVLNKSGGALIIAEVRTDIGIREADPPAGYRCLILLDKGGNILQKQRIEQPEFLSAELHRYVTDDRDVLASFYRMGIYMKDLIDGRDLPKVASPSFGVRNTVIIEFLKGNIPFSCQQVDTFRIVGKKGDIDARMEDYRFFPDSLQVLNYDFDTQQWQIKRYHLPSASFRKFKNFDLYPFANYPIYESVRLKNDYIVVTVFMKENNKSVVYQMLFDSVGRYIVPEKVQIINPKDIKKIPDGSKIYIKSFPVEGSWYKGKYRTFDVYIWGYDLEEGMLYWKKYHIK